MFIVLDLFGDALYITPCTNEDGENLLFDTREEAEQFARDECQEGLVVDIG